MDYSKIYRSLMEKGQNRVKDSDTYYERHHIIPKCLGGTDDLLNLVWLTPEEHYVAHQLLVKLNPNHLGLVSAVTFMATDREGRRVNNKLFGWLRRKASELQKGIKHSPERIEKMASAKRGKKVSDQARENLTRAARERVKNPAIIEKIRISATGKKHSEESKRKIGEGNSGKVLSEDTKKKLSEAWVKRRQRGVSEETKKKMSESRKAFLEKEKLKNVV